MLIFDSVSYKDDTTFFNNLSFELNQPDLLSIESSLPLTNLFIDVILGRRKPDSGTVKISLSENRKDYQVTDNIGIVDNDCFYDRLKVKEYLILFKGIHNSEKNIDMHLKNFGLLDVRNERIGKLSIDYKLKLSIARECLKDIKVLIIVEPLRNLDISSSKTIIDLLHTLNNNKIAILAFSSSFKEALMIHPTVFQLTEEGIQIAHEDKKTNNNQIGSKKLTRISAKLQDKTVIFSPYEIDYVESYDGQCIIYVKGCKFTSNETLNQLDEKLANYGFFRTHRSYIVNMQKIIEIVNWSKDSFSVILNNKDRSNVPLSKNRINELKSILSI